MKVKAARRRVEAANANATVENQLGNLTTSALDYLLRCQQLSTILDALMKLGERYCFGHSWAVYMRFGASQKLLRTVKSL